MSARRFVSRMRGLGLTQHAPASPTGEAGASGASMTSIRDFARVLGNPKEFVRG